MSSATSVGCKTIQGNSRRYLDALRLPFLVVFSASAQLTAQALQMKRQNRNKDMKVLLQNLKDGVHNLVLHTSDPTQFGRRDVHIEWTMSWLIHSKVRIVLADRCLCAAVLLSH